MPINTPTIVNETVKLFWVPEVANIDAPTTAEMGDAHDLTCIVETWPDLIPKSSDVDDPSLCSRFDRKIPGPISVDSGDLVLKWVDGDTEFEWARANLTIDTTGYMARVDAVGGVIPSETTDGTKVDLVPVRVSYTGKNQPEAGAKKLYTIGVTVPSMPKQDVAITT